MSADGDVAAEPVKEVFIHLVQGRRACAHLRAVAVTGLGLLLLTGREPCGREDRPARQWPRCGEGRH